MKSPDMKQDLDGMIGAYIVTGTHDTCQEHEQKKHGTEIIALNCECPCRFHSPECEHLAARKQLPDTPIEQVRLGI